MVSHPESPLAKVSVACDMCPEPDRPQPGCARCQGEGIRVLSVAPEHAALSAEELGRLYPDPS